MKPSVQLQVPAAFGPRFSVVLPAPDVVPPDTAWQARAEAWIARLASMLPVATPKGAA